MSDEVEEIIKRRGVSPINQKRLWARSTLVKQLLIRFGFITLEAWEKEEAAMVRDIENKIREQILQDLGLKGEGEE